MAISSEERTVLLRLAGSAPPPEHPLCKDGCGGGAIELCQGQGNPDNVGRYYQKPCQKDCPRALRIQWLTPALSPEKRLKLSVWKRTNADRDVQQQEEVLKKSSPTKSAVASPSKTSDKQPKTPSKFPRAPAAVKSFKAGFTPGGTRKWQRDETLEVEPAIEPPAPAVPAKRSLDIDIVKVPVQYFYSADPDATPIRGIFQVPEDEHPFIFLGDFQDVLRELGLDKENFKRYDAHFGIFVPVHANATFSVMPRELVIFAHVELKVRQAPSIVQAVHDVNLLCWGAEEYPRGDLDSGSNYSDATAPTLSSSPSPSSSKHKRAKLSKPAPKSGAYSRSRDVLKPRTTPAAGPSRRKGVKKSESVIELSD